MVRVEVGTAAVEPVLQVGVLSPALLAHGRIEAVLLGGGGRVAGGLARLGADGRLEGCGREEAVAKTGRSVDGH